MNELFILLKDVLKDRVGLLFLLILILFIIANLDKITGFINGFKTPPLPPFINLDNSSHALTALRDYEEAKAFQARGMTYLEGLDRERIFCLHKLLKGAISIPEISLAAPFVKTDKLNKYYILIPKEKKIIYCFVSAASLIVIISMLALSFYISAVDLETYDDHILVLSIYGFQFYFLFMLGKAFHSVHAAKRVLKLIGEKNFFFTPKNKER